MTAKLTGLVAATHTPFHQDGQLHLAIVEKQAELLLRDGVTTAFIGGSTGECTSLTLDERLRLAERWADVARGSAMRVIVHVGSSCLADARTLARQAQQLGALAIAALAPSYYKPNSLDILIACCADVAGAAPDTPFYYYSIPALTGINLPMPDFLRQAGDRIPNLAGIKFTEVDFMAYQLCREVDRGRFDILWGVDEMLLSALACGAQGAVGSTFNFAAPLYRRLVDAFQRCDLAAAQREQLRSVQLVRTLAARGYIASAKALMSLRGVDVGPPRLPNTSLSTDQFEALRRELEVMEGLTS